MGALLSAYERAGRWRDAIALLREAQLQHGVSANQYMYNISIAAAGKAGEWRTAEDLFREMAERGVPYGELGREGREGPGCGRDNREP